MTCSSVEEQSSCDIAFPGIPVIGLVTFICTVSGHKYFTKIRIPIDINAFFRVQEIEYSASVLAVYAI